MEQPSEPVLPPDVSTGFPLKRSFLKLPVAIDVKALLRDYHNIPRTAWSSSHWDIHCSTNMLLLRGGRRGSAEDFITSEVSNAPVLSRLPYIASLIGPEGPFGGCRYAFIMRMKPMGITRVHCDDNPAWKTPFRLHIPIITNPDSVLLSEKMARHFYVGEVVTFDNQSMHSVVNGDSVRTHLIIDVDPNPRLETLLRNAAFDPGIRSPALWAKTTENEATPRPMLTVESEPLEIAEKEALGLDPDGFAARVTRRRLIARLTRAPLCEDDILFSVNGVEECAVARTATSYIQIRHAPGEILEVGIIRQGERRVRKLKLYPNPLPAPVLAGLSFLRSARYRYSG